ncbi:hypothetical protein ASG01_12555 [Chryseobacterium sp. Leaf180]|uniref:Crp/Fnr family transcriptional regulator n=1 Tax=Chryseobacterium sp. Leaf180 TaxID=1736289 RepID=UPI0007000E82|nr:Crp/Fnr family transcriptional regulator [Chryseobacterium sp. Leaf180]KQR91832.1 hypothetical protein ASG01_12555 [Chryseobacterium sp. Leaf180]
MVIDEKVLFSEGAVMQNYHPDEIIFREGTTAKYYYQITEGIVKMTTVLENGKEFVHGFPFEGHSLGESYLFSSKEYAVNAIAVSQVKLLKIDREKLHAILRKNPELYLDLYKYSADRLHFRYVVSTFLCMTDPVEKILILLNYMKTFFSDSSEEFTFQVPYTRSQLALLTGLRVETVIRTVKKLEKAGTVIIKNKKIYF